MRLQLPSFAFKLGETLSKGCVFILNKVVCKEVTGKKEELANSSLSFSSQALLYTYSLFGGWDTNIPSSLNPGGGGCWEQSKPEAPGQAKAAGWPHNPGSTL